MEWRPTLLVIVFSILLPSALSEIKTTNIISDARSSILFEEFGFSSNGVASVSLNSVSWASRTPNFSLSSLGFYLLSDSSDFSMSNESDHSNNFCPLSSNFSLLVLTFQDLRNSAANNTVLISNPDKYNLCFANCLSNSVEVTMDVYTEMYNVDSYGRRQYLPIGRKWLPLVYIVFFVTYCVFLGFWGFVCHKQRMTVGKIHMVMAALLLFKGLKMVCAAEDLWHVQSTGMPHGWDVAFYVFGFFKGVLFFTVIALIGTGWSLLKPYLQEREKSILMVIIPLQVIVNIARAIIGEGGTVLDDWLTWIQLFSLVDLVCFCLVFVPLLWSIRSLREASKTDGKAALNLQKLTLFKQFYLVLVGYLYFTGIIALEMEDLISYRYLWLVAATEESANLMFNVYVFFNFRPVERNPYLYIGDEEEIEAGEALEMD